MANFRSAELQYSNQTAFPDISSRRSVNHFGELMHDMPAESEEFLSDDDLPSPEGYHSPYSRRLSYGGRFQVDEDDSACVAPLDLYPPSADSAHPFVNMPPSYLHQGALEHPVTNSPELHHATSTAPGPSDNPTLMSHARVRLAPRRRRFRCETCQKTFDRPSRLENCRNRHSNSKPHECLGACGLFGCIAKYSSVEYLERHISPTNQCPSCGENVLKQNMARHRASCKGH